MNRAIRLSLLLVVGLLKVRAADLYGASATADSIALGGIYLGGTGPTDALAANPAVLTSFTRPYLEVTGTSVFGAGSFRNVTPYPGTLNSNLGLAGSAAFAVHIPKSKLTFGVGVFPVSLLSDRWTSGSGGDCWRLLRRPIEQVCLSGHPVVVWRRIPSVAVACHRCLSRHSGKPEHA